MLWRSAYRSLPKIVRILAWPIAELSERKARGPLHHGDQCDAEVLARSLPASFDRKVCFDIVLGKCLTNTSKRREAKYQKLCMARLPMMKINTEASDVLSPHVAPRVHDLKKLFRFITAEELRVQELGHPIHLMSVGEIKRDLNVFIGVLKHDNAVVINVCVRPFAFEEDHTTRLHFCCPKPGRLKKRNRIGKRERRRG